MTDLASRLGAVIGGFFAWWFKELAGLVPARLRGALEGSADAAMLDLSGPEIVISRLSGRRWRELGRVNPQGLNEPAQASAFAGLIKKAKLDELDLHAPGLGVAHPHPVVEVNLIGAERCVAVHLEGQHLAQILFRRQGKAEGLA